MHDHPWWFVTLILSGGYTDIGTYRRQHMTMGSIAYRPALYRHIVKVDPGGCWTLLFTGPKMRRFGFWVEDKFIWSGRYFRKYGKHTCES